MMGKKPKLYLESLTITLKEALESNRQDAIAAAKQIYKEEPVFV